VLGERGDAPLRGESVGRGERRDESSTLGCSRGQPLARGRHEALIFLIRRSTDPRRLRALRKAAYPLIVMASSVVAQLNPKSAVRVEPAMGPMTSPNAYEPVRMAERESMQSPSV